MTATLGILLTVLVASLLGSVHCAGMCGGLVLFAVGADGKLRKQARLHIAYHAARGLAYTALGVAAGTIGAATDIGARLNGGVRASAIVAGGLMVALGIASLLQNLGVLSTILRPPKALQKTAERAHRRAFGLPPVHRAAAVGFLTPLLPCGWLYAFVVVAAGTGSPLFGAAVMASFWMGTLPLMGLLGLGLNTLTGPLRQRLPAVTSVIVIALGVLTALGRVNIPTVVAPEVGLASLDERLKSATTMTHADMLCCNPDAPLASVDDADVQEADDTDDAP
jgi:sulfite exporter TauE/SafE